MAASKAPARERRRKQRVRRAVTRRAAAASGISHGDAAAPAGSSTPFSTVMISMAADLGRTVARHVQGATLCIGTTIATATHKAALVGVAVVPKGLET